jgi:mannosylglycoprotein endo-beta-mannosidase
MCAWARGSSKSYSSAIVVDKLKGLRQELKKWHMSLARPKSLIQNCNKVILILDTLEEERTLYRPQFNYWQVVKLHLEELLATKCNYWKKRCTIRWIKQGEDNTKFFHAMATKIFRRNSISVLQDEDGNEISDHQAMVALL